jgi:ABC-type bacteriocin/lantibiotic exporter with double-glycine peptidase domain
MHFIKKILNIIGERNNRQAVWLTFIGLISSIFEVLGVGAIIPIITLILDQNKIILLFKEYSLDLYFLGMSEDNIAVYILSIIAFIYLMKFIFLVFYLRKQAELQKNIQIYVADELMDKYLHMPYERFLEYNSSKFFRNINVEIGLMSNVVLVYMNIFSEVLMALGVLFLMLIFDYKSTLILFFIFSIVGLVYYYLLRLKVDSLGSKRLSLAKKRVQLLQDIFNSIKIGIVHDLSHEYSHSYKQSNDSMSLVSSKFKVLSSMPKILFEFTAVFVILIIIYSQLSQSEKSPDGVITILALFSIAAIRLMPSFSKILTSTQTLKAQLPGVKELIKELNYNYHEGVIPNQNVDVFNWKKISLKEVSYKYPCAKSKSLKNINVEIERGEVVGIYGRSGSGKSTLVDLIIGLLSPTRGAIFIDSFDLSHISSKWMKNIGYVPQDIHLLDSTILHNIVGEDFNANKINKKNLDNAFKISGLDSIIDSLENGVLTLVGERGSWLSGGQKQRIGVARAIYRNPTLLIFDEPTSSLDAESRMVFRDLLLKYKGELTFVIISHDLRDMEICDKKFEVDSGKVKLLLS